MCKSQKMKIYMSIRAWLPSTSKSTATAVAAAVCTGGGGGGGGGGGVFPSICSSSPLHDEKETMIGIYKHKCMIS